MSKADNLASLLNSSGLIDSDDISAGAVSAAKLADGSVDSDVLGAGSVTDSKYGGTLSVSNGDITVGGTITDDVSAVRTPRRTAISTPTTIANEGVYYCTSNPTLTLGAPAVGTIMTIYNNSASNMTLNRGSTVGTMRIAADNNTTNKTAVTLGAYSTTTITLFTSTFAVVSGTDVT